MINTIIYKDFYAFQGRANRDENGVSEHFARNNRNYQEVNLTNKGCWECKGCERCYHCTECINCTGSQYLLSSEGMVASTNCYNCSYCYAMSDGNNESNINQCDNKPTGHYETLGLNEHCTS